MSGAPSALGGLRVLDLGRGFAGALATQFLADYGALVLRVEPPGGDPLRAEPAFRLWHRGKQSVVADLRTEAGRAEIRRLAAGVDILVETFRPATAVRLGLSHADLAPANPGLIQVSITGFGRRGPYADWKGYEGVVMAKMGGMSHVAGMAPRPGPAFPSVPYASYGAAQCALAGTLAALYVRERTGRGQLVEASLVQGLAAYDPWEWFLRIICERYPNAFTPAPPYSERGVPTQGFAFRLLVALTRDGRWLQFSQTSPHLFREFMESLDLAWMFDDPEWSTAPDFDTEEKRKLFWERMLAAVRERTFAEWEAVFRERPNVWAEPFRTPGEALDHPQMIHNGHVVGLDDPTVGPTVQLAPPVRLARTPAGALRPAPRPGEHAPDAISDAHAGRRGAPDPGGEPASRPDRATRGDGDGGPIPSGSGAAEGKLPLEGVTVLELGLWYAAPYGSALLADLGARVIKIEPIAGEPMRHAMPFPDAGAVKVLQGKESVALDLEREEARDVVRRIARRADLVLMSYRAGVAERLGVDYESLARENPRLVYLSAPGYGSDGPCARKPAFAPTIGAASGIGLRQAGPSIPHGPDLSLEEIEAASIRLNWSAQAPGNADGCGALGVATALLLGLVARERTGIAQEMLTSMLCFAAYALSVDGIQFEGRAPSRQPDPDLFGLSARYRLYEASDGWVFLAAPKESEWRALCAGLEPHGDREGTGAGDAVRSSLGRDPRFVTEEARGQNDAALAAELAAILRTRPAGDWEHDLLAFDVACAAVEPGPVARAVISDPIVREAGFLAEVEHPTFGVHRRLAPLVGLSATPGRVGPAPKLGQHTRGVLAEAGLAGEEIDDLFARGIAG